MKQLKRDDLKKIKGGRPPLTPCVADGVACGPGGKGTCFNEGGYGCCCTLDAGNDECFAA